MKLTALLTDQGTIDELGSRVAQLRLQRNQSQSELAGAAGVSTRTLARLEAGESTSLTNFVRVLRALGLIDRLELLIPPALPSPIEEARGNQAQRRRASRPRKPSAREAEETSSATDRSDGWSWGDQPGQTP